MSQDTPSEASPTTETILTVTENLLGILLAGGLDPQDAAWACDTLVLLVTASAHEDEMRRPQNVDQQIEDLRTTFAALPPERFPLLSSYADEIVSGDGALRFRFAIDIVVDGLVARSKRPL
jgi:hypothetical protein